MGYCRQQEGVMRIAGYVRETPGPSGPDTAFAQSERIRRWAKDTGNELVAMCQDHQAAASPTDRPGFMALLDVARNGNADSVVIASLESLSPDKVLQEIMITDIRAAGVTVIATDSADLEVLQDGGDDHARMVVRDIVARVSEYREAFGLSGSETPSVSGDDGRTGDGRATTDVVVKLIAPTG
jgi:DNA invertase Pin-like site-specific DNA recombinase